MKKSCETEQAKKILWSHLDLEARDVANSASKHTTDSHQDPEIHGEKAVKVKDNRDLAHDDHERDEQEHGVDIVVEGQEPDVVVHHRQDSFDVDRIQ